MFISDDAVFAKSYIGVGANKIPVTMYNIKTNVYNTYFTVIDDGCLPYLYESTGTLPNGGKINENQSLLKMHGTTDRNFLYRLRS